MAGAELKIEKQVGGCCLLPPSCGNKKTELEDEAGKKDTNLFHMLAAELRGFVSDKGRL